MVEYRATFIVKGEPRFDSPDKRPGTGEKFCRDIDTLAQRCGLLIGGGIVQAGITMGPSGQFPDASKEFTCQLAGPGNQPNHEDIFIGYYANTHKLKVLTERIPRDAAVPMIRFLAERYLCVTITDGPNQNDLTGETFSVESKTLPVLERLAKIVQEHCEKSKGLDFLFSNSKYMAAVQELRDNQTAPEYAVSCQESPKVAELWRQIRLGIIEYNKCLIRPAKWVEDELGDISHFLLVPKFETPNDPPHVLDGVTMKTFISTLDIAESPRKTINKSPVYKAPKTVRGVEHPDVDIDTLPLMIGRFALTRDYKTIVDVNHRSPDYEIHPYLKMKESAAEVIKRLLAEYNKKKNDGCVPCPVLL